MKAYLISILILAGLLTSAQAQNRSFGTLPLAQKPGASAGFGQKLENEKYKIAREVYDRLVAARGDIRNPVPPFALRKDEKSVAYINYDPLEIVLEEKAYDVCAKFGGDTAKAAIAFLIGHELSHHYEKHAWRRGFAHDFKDLPIGMKLDSLMDDVAHETEADYLGGFLTYSAGYGLFDKGAEVIKKLYDAYSLPAKIPGYPSLPDRQEMSRRTAQKLEDLINVFEMANLLTATGNYAEAAEFYKHVLLDYQSREIYNNVGVTIALDALQLFKENELKFRYPLELDLESSATKGSGAADTREVLLNQALLFFDAAISLDPGYAPAYLNKACAYALLGDTLRARFYAETETRRAVQRDSSFKKTGIDADVLLGILAANAGDKAKAKKLFETAAATPYGALAAINLKLLNGEALGEETPPPPGLGREKIDDQTMTSITDPDDGVLKRDDKRTIVLSDKLVFYQNPKQGDNSYVVFSQNDAKGTTSFFHITKPGYTGKTARKIGLGDTRKAIAEKYGEPKRTVETPNGQILVYKNILFVVSGDKLTRWANYSEVK